MQPLEELWSLGRSAWPDVALGLEEFGRHLARHRGEEGDEIVHVTDLFLTCACVLGTQAALIHFEQILRAQVAPALSRFQPTPEFIDEVSQELRGRLLVAEPGETPRIAEYSGRGPLGGWLRVAAIRTGLNLRRGRREQPAREPAAIEQREPAPGPDVEQQLLRARYQPEFRQALEASILALSPAERSYLRMHFLDGLTLEEVASAHAVSRATAVRRIAAARAAVFEQVKRQMRERLGVSGAEMRSLLGALRSQLNVSLSQALRKGA